MQTTSSACRHHNVANTYVCAIRSTPGGRSIPPSNYRNSPRARSTMNHRTDLNALGGGPICCPFVTERMRTHAKLGLEPTKQSRQTRYLLLAELMQQTHDKLARSTFIYSRALQHGDRHGHYLPLTWRSVGVPRRGISTTRYNVKDIGTNTTKDTPHKMCSKNQWDCIN